MRTRCFQTAVAILLLVWSVPCAAEGLSGNLLVNGDAEAHRCTSDWTAQSPVPGWRVVRGAASVLCYGAFASTGVTPNLPSDRPAGNALFAGPGIDSAMEQTLDVGRAAAAIDLGAASYELSGWLGGWSDREQSAMVTAVFLNDRGEATGDAAILADLDSPASSAATGLVARSTGGQVPAGTRKIAVTLDFPSGRVSFQNAFADNVQLRLGGAGAPLSAAPLQAPSARDVPRLDHVFVVMMENTNYADVVHGDARSLRIDEHMPFLASLAKRGVLLSNMWATYHPSDQNYVAMVAGDTYRYGPVYYPDFDLPVTHLGDLLDAHGKPWRGYVQHMKTPCNLLADSNGGWYSPDDEPFANFDDVIANSVRCKATLRDLNDLDAAVKRGAALPDFAWIAADGWWDGEGAWMDRFDVGESLAKQDEFLESAFASLLQYPQWQDSRSLLIVTWDETDGWGWPDNHVPTVIVGSPGLLREGQVIDAHYDGYGVLRTVESALGLESLGRFDAYARPLVEIFSGSDDSSQPAELTLRPSEAASTRGSLQDTFGRVAVRASVVQGEALRLFAPPGVAGAAVIAPLGRPSTQAARFAIDASGLVTIPTAQLGPGTYGAWLEPGDGPPVRAPLPFAVLPRSQITPGAPGVEILGATPRGAGSATAVREGANVVVRYCRPRGAAASGTWIGVFPDGTPIDQLTRDNANLIGYWLKTPGNSTTDLCGEASAYTSELTPSAAYEILLMQDEVSGSSVPVGAHAEFELMPTLP